MTIDVFQNGSYTWATKSGFLSNNIFVMGNTKTVLVDIAPVKPK